MNIFIKDLVLIINAMLISTPPLLLAGNYNFLYSYSGII